MVSKQAEKSIKQYRRFAKLLSILYRSPNEMTKWRIKLFRWFVDLQGTFGPKVKGTVKEEFNFNGVNTWKISTPNSNPDRVLLYFHGGAYSLGSPKSHYSLVSYLADITKTTVYVPDYRLDQKVNILHNLWMQLRYITIFCQKKNIIQTR